MSIVALERIQLCLPLGDMGDRNILGGTTFIKSNEWHVEADIHLGSLKDVHVYRNTNATTPTAQPNWQWYAAIPTANIKAYRLAGELPTPQALDAQPQAPTPAQARSAPAAAIKS